MIDTIKKRSVMIRGHRTAVSIEDAFWTHVKRLAKRRGGVALLLADVDANRKGRSLSSSLRIAVLDDLTATHASLLAEIQTLAAALNEASLHSTAQVAAEDFAHADGIEVVHVDITPDGSKTVAGEPLNAYLDRTAPQE
jgi:predicted DNA-binding ribbon-helix-helix protein